jgi:hypothetical protein
MFVCIASAKGIINDMGFKIRMVDAGLLLRIMILL